MLSTTSATVATTQEVRVSTLRTCTPVPSIGCVSSVPDRQA
jgi:hypothetical protein